MNRIDFCHHSVSGDQLRVGGWRLVPTLLHVVRLSTNSMCHPHVMFDKMWRMLQIPANEHEANDASEKVVSLEKGFVMCKLPRFSWQKGKHRRATASTASRDSGRHRRPQIPTLILHSGQIRRHHSQWKGQPRTYSTYDRGHHRQVSAIDGRTLKE